MRFFQCGVELGLRSVSNTSSGGDGTSPRLTFFTASVFALGLSPLVLSVTFNVWYWSLSSSECSKGTSLTSSSIWLDILCVGPSSRVRVGMVSRQAYLTPILIRDPSSRPGGEWPRETEIFPVCCRNLPVLREKPAVSATSRAVNSQNSATGFRGQPRSSLWANGRS